MNAREKLWSLIGESIGWATTRIAGDEVARIHARSARIQQLADAQTQIEVRMHERLKTLVEKGADPAEFAEEVAWQKAIRREIREIRNIGQIFGIASEDLAEEAVTDKEIDEDWRSRFVELGGKVSQAELQGIWGRVLANEIRRPGMTSLRTLTALAHLSKDEALRFAELCQFVIGGQIVFQERPYTAEFPELEVNNLVKVQDSGLTEYGHGLILQLDWESNPQLVTYQRGILVLESTVPISQQSLRGIPGQRLTTVGKDILAISEHQPNTRYLRQLATFLAKNQIDLFFMQGQLQLPRGYFRQPTPDERILPIADSA